MDGAQLVVTLLKAKASLSSIGSSPFGGGNSVKGEDTDNLITSVQNSWLYIVAAAGVVSGVTSLYWIVGSIVDFACIATCCVAPLTVYQKHKLKNLGGMRYQQNRLRRSVNEFSAENDKLASNVTELERNVLDLKNVEQDLKNVVAKTGGNVDRLVGIIKLNGELQTKVKANLESSVMQSILTAVLVSDLNEDFTLNTRELKRVETRLNNLPGINFDRKKFRAFVGGKSELHLNDIMKMLRNLKDKDHNIPEDQHIFTLAPEKM